MGKDGSRAYSGETKAEVPAFTCVQAIETTGAGDTFFGGILHHVIQWGLRPYSQEELTQMLTFATLPLPSSQPKKALYGSCPMKTKFLI